MWHELKISLWKETGFKQTECWGGERKKKKKIVSLQTALTWELRNFIKETICYILIPNN